MTTYDIDIKVADSFLSRLRGLLFAPPLPPGKALLIKPCSSVHTAFMGYTIDVLFIDRTGTILKIAHNLAPWRAAMCPKAYQTLELFAGEAQRLGLKVGDSLADNFAQLG